MNNIKVCNVQQGYRDGSKVTTFHIYELIDDRYVFCYNDFIHGWYKKPSTVLNKILK